MSTKRRASQLKISLFSFQDIITSVTGVMILVTLMLSLELINRKENSPPVQTAEQITTTDKTIEQLRAEIQIAEQQLAAAKQSVTDLPSFDAKELAEMNRDISQNADRLRSELTKLRSALNDKRHDADQSRIADEQGKLTEGKIIDSLESEIAEIEQKIKDLEGSNRVFFSSGIKDKTVWIVEITARGYSVAQIGIQMAPLQFATANELEQWLATINAASSALYLLVKPGGASYFHTLQEALRSKIDFGYQVVGSSQQILDPKVGAGVP